MKKKIALIAMSALLLSGCVKQSTTVDIKADGSAIVEKKLSTGATNSLGTNSLTQMVEEKFVESLRAQNPVSLMRYETNSDSGVIGIIKHNNIANHDIFAYEKFYKPKNKKNLDCIQNKTGITCNADFVVNIKSEEIDKILAKNELKYEDLAPYVLKVNLPINPEYHNAMFFDVEKNSYIWEIPAGVEVPVSFKFNLKY